jgi:MFS transporter, FHS family, L-fucose permease
MEIQRHALVKRDYLVPFVLVTSLFFLWGFAHAILDVLNKHFQEVMDITRTHSAMVQVMFYLGYFIMAIPAKRPHINNPSPPKESTTAASRAFIHPSSTT